MEFLRSAIDEPERLESLTANFCNVVLPGHTLCVGANLKSRAEFPAEFRETLLTLYGILLRYRRR